MFWGNTGITGIHIDVKAAVPAVWPRESEAETDTRADTRSEIRFGYLNCALPKLLVDEEMGLSTPIGLDLVTLSLHTVTLHPSWCRPMVAPGKAPIPGHGDGFS